MSGEGRGLDAGADFAGLEAGASEALKGASRLVSQAAGIALVCSLALEAAFNGDLEQRDADSVADISARLLFEAHDDLAAAVGLVF